MDCVKIGQFVPLRMPMLVQFVPPKTFQRSMNSGSDSDSLLRIIPAPPSHQKLPLDSRKRADFAGSLHGCSWHFIPPLVHQKYDKVDQNFSNNVTIDGLSA